MISPKANKLYKILYFSVAKIHLRKKFMLNNKLSNFNFILNIYIFK